MPGGKYDTDEYAAAHPMPEGVKAPKIHRVPQEAYALCEACPEAGAACPNGLCKTCGDVMKIVIQVPCKLNKWKFIEESNGL